LNVASNIKIKLSLEESSVHKEDYAISYMYIKYVYHSQGSRKSYR
jgi:hypothetical protein